MRCQRYYIDRSRCNCKRMRNAGRRRGHVNAELVSRRCTLIRLLCTVIGCGIRPFTRFIEQMEANRGRRSCMKFSLVLGHQLVTRRQVPRSQITVLSDVKTLFRTILNEIIRYPSCFMTVVFNRIMQ